MGVAAAPIALAAAGTGLQMYGDYRQGLAQSNYYKYLAGQDRTQADLTREQGQQEAGFAQTEGSQQQAILSRKVAETEGSQRAAEGANGTAGSVTAADISMDTFDKAKLDSMAIKYNADLKSWRAQREAALKANSLENEATGYDAAAKESKRSSRLKMAGTFLSGASQITGMAMGAKPLSPTQG